jgi:serine/threonine-protein kinase
MKYVEGQTLKDILADHTLTVSDILHVMEPVADALTYAHRHDVLHRDIKPSNMVVDERGTPYLTDFGLARIAQAGESSLSADMLIGTPHYISPEQARGERDLDGRTDVYSLGVIVYELMTGAPSGDTPTSSSTTHLQRAAPTH